MHDPQLALDFWSRSESPQVGGLEEWLVDVGGAMVARSSGGRTAGMRRFIARVGAEEHRAQELVGEPLSNAVQETARLLRSTASAEQATAFAFALVRETARRELGLRHHEGQLHGGRAMLDGMVAEMATGEGKTLAAVLPAVTWALRGWPVHVVTVNDYLVRRDAEWMGPIYRALGLSVAAVTGEMDEGERRDAYRSDIVYCSNKQLVFDYLKDHMLVGQQGGPVRVRLQGLHADHPGGERLLLPGLYCAIIDEADSVLIDEAKTPLVISQQQGGEIVGQSYRQALWISGQLDAEREFSLDPLARRAELTTAGRRRAAELAAYFGGLIAGEQRREQLVVQALAARHLYARDRDYLVRDGRVVPIDEYTGRTLPGRAWERGLQQLLEAKEGCPLSRRSETLARISFQRFFRKYRHLAGMTGTASEAAHELWSVYRLRVATVPVQHRERRRIARDRLFVGRQERLAALVGRITALRATGRPVLVGTHTVAESERLGDRLAEAGIEHSVLNARQDSEEARIIAAAGQAGTVTVATEMAGRGTDIRLGDGVATHGGLHVIAVGRHAVRRVDRQLFGRCARQGDPGSCEAYLCADDELIVLSTGGRVLARWRGGFAIGWVGRSVTWLAQTAAERRLSRQRRRLLQSEKQLERTLAFSGKFE